MLRWTTLLLACALALTPAPAPAAPPPSSGFLLGAHVDQGGANGAAAAVDAFEDTLDRRLDLVRWYSRWDDPQPPGPVSASVARGRTPLLSIWPMRRDGSRVSWATIASGAVDDQIRAQAAGVASLGVPVHLALHHEADIARGWGSPAEFRTAWRHYVEVFRAAGVGEVRWTWIMTPGSFGSAQTTAGADAFYPGDDVVDRVGLDAYNWYGCAPAKPPTWRSLAAVVGPFRSWATARGKTPLLAEFGSVPDPADPSRRPTWLRDAVDWLAAWPELEAASLFEGVGTCDWRIGADAPARAAFAEAVRQPGVRAAPSAWARLTSTIGPAPLSVGLDPTRSTGDGSAAGTGIAAWQVDWGDGSAPSVGTGQPTGLRHSYPAGDWTLTLTVTDTTGLTAVDRQRVVSSQAATVTGSETVAGTTATLRAWADPHGLAGTITLAWGPEGSAPIGRVQYALAATGYAQAFAQNLTGLLPGTRYVWTATATTSAGSSTVTRVLDTPGPPVVRALPATGVGRTAATVPLRVHPHGLDTQVWVEWGPGFGRRTAAQSFPAASWERAGTEQLVGLAAGTEYPFRVVAANAAGTAVGPPQSLKTLP
ncbi:glycosyl hydrolase [Cellulomonas taurus]|uniref:glycosyl hydrolase n=1 Tax=Cellulomonas taurus TaxID=2729175 RepID=UPI00145EB15B|nr:glycosyl hydrolase [Cellulomonas taurus]